MQRRPKRLPPLSALRGFEAAARLSSFSKAATELHMTQSAISHQIKLLEDFFGQPLFKRINRTVEVTDAGLDFLETTTQALDILATGAYRLEFYKKPGSVVITTPPSFASKWLLPKLEELREIHPEVDPWIHTTEEQDSPESSEVDIGLWYGDGSWSGVIATRLFNDSVTPLVSPSRLQQSPLNSPEELANHPLIHVEQLERREDWRSWLSLADVEDMDCVSGLNLSDSGLALDCAVAGQGVVLGSKLLAAPMLEDGRLVQPFDLCLPTEINLYLVTTEEKLQQPAVKSCYDWLLSLSDQSQSA